MSSSTEIVEKTESIGASTSQHGDVSQDTQKVQAAKPTSSPPLLCLGSARTGTASLMKALQILGYTKVHHGWEVCEAAEHQWQWPIFDRANDATFPNLPTYRGTPFSRAEWDELFGQYEAVSDIASFYAESLIPAYPDAKVILVERDVDKWLKSITPITQGATKPLYRAFVTKLSNLTGYTSGPVCFRMQQGWTRSESPNDIVKNLRSAYLRHNKYIRDNVPNEQLLDYKIADGWEPLCTFLGKEVPDVPFPHVNDSAEYKARSNRLGKKIMKLAAKRVLCPCLS